MDAFSEEVSRLHHEFGENLDRCRKLLQMRDAGRLTSDWRLDALISAAELSHTVRTLTDALDGAMDGYDIPLPLLPGTVLGATARLTYALVGFAEEDPDAEQLLSLAELDGLVAQYELEPWMAMFERTRAELDAEDAGNLGTVLQSMRRREDLLRVLGRTPGTAMFPSLLIDQLFYSFTLLAAPGNEETDPPAYLSADALARLLTTSYVQEWLASVDARDSLRNPLTSRFAFENDEDEAD